MGQEIVRQESPKKPEKRSRLWFHEDIIQVLEENSGTSKIEIICLNFSPHEKIVEWKGDEFKKMKNLKSLVVKPSFYLLSKIENTITYFKPEVHFPNSLRVLEWFAYPSKHMPYDYSLKNLSMCKLSNSDLVSFNLANSSKDRVMISSSSSCILNIYLLNIFFFFEEVKLALVLDNLANSLI